MKIRSITTVIITFIIGCGCQRHLDHTDSVIHIKISGKTYTEPFLRSLVGKTVTDIGKEMGFDLTRRKLIFHDEPPGYLCGIEIDLPGDDSIRFFIDSHDPFFKLFDENRKWREQSIVTAKVGGIQCTNDKVCIEVGQIPFPWRRK